jgi:hypothetical protein
VTYVFLGNVLRIGRCSVLLSCFNSIVCMSARFVPRGDAAASLRKLAKADGLIGSEYVFLTFADICSVAGLIIRPTTS